MGDLGKKGVSAVKWSAVSTVGRFGMQLLAQVFLARLLGPDVYGVFGLGLVVFTFAMFIAEFGFTMSLVQRQTLSDEDIRLITTWQWMAGFLVGLVLFLAAPAIANYFNEPRVIAVVRWMSLACLFTAGSVPRYSLLSRQMNFRTVGLIDLGAYIVGYLVLGIPLAWMGWGVDALIVAWMAQVIVKFVALHWVCKAPSKPLFWSDQARSILLVGGTVFVTNLVNWLLTNLDRVAVGRLLNAHAVGVYSAAYNLANTPNALLLGSLQGVFLAAGAKVQDQQDRLRQVYQQILAAVWTLVAPTFVVLSVLASDIILLLYGERWAEAGHVFAWLLIAMPFYVAWGVSTPILWNTGRSIWESLLQVPVLIVGAVVLYSVASKGVEAAAMVAACIFMVRGLVMQSAACRVLGVSLSDMVPQVVRTVLLSVLVGAAAWLSLQLCHRLGLGTFCRLVLGGAAPLALALAMVSLWPRQTLGDPATAMVLRFAPRLSKWLIPDGREERVVP